MNSASAAKAFLCALCVSVMSFAVEAAELHPDLASAVQKGEWERAQRLITQGQDPSARDAQGYDALDYAIEWGQKKISQHLLDLRTQAALTTEAARLFQKAVAEGKPQSPSGDTRALATHLLRSAANRGDLVAMRALLASGAGVDDGAKDGYSALALAVRWKHREAVEMLLNAGANVNLHTQTCYQTVPLMEATRHGDTALLQRLINAGARINEPDKYGDHALNWAVYFGQTEQVKMLVQHGADLSRTGQTDDTPIEIAIRQKHKEIVDFLSSKGAKARPGKAPPF